MHTTDTGVDKRFAASKHPNQRSQEHRAALAGTAREPLRKIRLVQIQQGKDLVGQGRTIAHGVAA